MGDIALCEDADAPLKCSTGKPRREGHKEALWRDMSRASLRRSGRRTGLLDKPDSTCLVVRQLFRRRRDDVGTQR